MDDVMRPEYDFSGGVRGKHHKVLREEGYVVRIYNDDGTVNSSAEISGCPRGEK
jgi:hypothetical protein